MSIPSVELPPESARILKRFDHVGIAVRDVEKALSVYRNVLGGRLTLFREMGTTNDYYFTQIILAGQKIEFIEPIAEKESFLTKFLRERGEGLHHLTFQVDDIQKAVSHLKSAGLRVVDEFYEDPLWRTAFISPRSSNGALIQIYQTSPGSAYDG